MKKAIYFIIILIFVCSNTSMALLVEERIEPPNINMFPAENFLEKAKTSNLQNKSHYKYEKEDYVIDSFINSELIPKEIKYFDPKVAVDPESGVVYDHARLLRKSGDIINIGKYTAPSKFSLQIPALLGVIQQKSGFKNTDISPQEARGVLKKMFKSFLDFNKSHPDYHGFIPWVDIKSDGSLRPSDNMLPSLDNGQYTWALASVVSALGNSSNKKDQKIAHLAKEILKQQDYSKFYDSDTGLLQGAVEVKENGDWKKTGYYLQDMFEGTMAVLWGVLHGQIPEKAWENLKIPTVDYTTQEGEEITTFQGFRGSFHEHWALGYLPFMESKLAPLYKNFLYAQADYANKKGLPGFLSTAYDSKGSYRQMGVPQIASQPVDRSDVAVGFATAMGMLIDPKVGAKWLKNYYNFPGIQTKYGAVESVGSDGYADIITADGKGMTVLASTGGVVSEIKNYLKNHKVPGTDTTMYEKFMELTKEKYKQMKESRWGEDVHMPSEPYPVPAENQIEVKGEEMPSTGKKVNISNLLQPGHLHGKNVTTVGESSLMNDIKPGGILEFEYSISKEGDQWAFRGTYLKKAIDISHKNYLVVSIPADSKPHLFDIELKRDDTLLATARINTNQEGKISKDGKWKTIAVEINPQPLSDKYPCNYISVAIHDPANLPSEFKSYGRSGVIKLKDIKLTQNHPFLEKQGKGEVPVVKGKEEIVQHWSPSHGNLEITEDKGRNVIRFEGGGGWRGGYVPATDISDYDYAVVKVRNLSGTSNEFWLELKHEGENLLGGKKKIRLPSDDKWHTIKVDLPSNINKPLNYLAVSDPYGRFELSSIAFRK